MKKGLILFSVISILISLGVFHYRENTVDDSIFEFLVNNENFNVFEEVSSQPPVFIVSFDGTEVGYVVFGREVGYQSKIETATLIDRDGKIISVETFRQNETPAFYKRLIENNFFNQFEEKNISSGFKSGINIDAVSQATVSSNAAAKSVHESAVYLGNNILNIPVEDLYSTIRFGLTEISILILFLLVILAVCRVDKPS